MKISLIGAYGESLLADFHNLFLAACLDNSGHNGGVVCSAGSEEVSEGLDELRIVERELEALAKTAVIQHEIALLLEDVSDLQFRLAHDGHINVGSSGSSVLVLLVGEEIDTYIKKGSYQRW